MAKDMKTKFDKYWETYTMVLSIGAILDPRYKLNIIEFYLSELGMEGPLLIEKVQSVEDGLRKLYNAYKIQPNVMQGSTKGPSSNVVGEKFCDDAEDDLAGFETFQSQYKKLEDTNICLPFVIVGTILTRSFRNVSYLVPIGLLLMASHPDVLGGLIVPLVVDDLVYDVLREYWWFGGKWKAAALTHCRLRRRKEFYDKFTDLSDMVHDVNLGLIVDRWVWSLEGSGEFTVASIHKKIDDKRLLGCEMYDSVASNRVPLSECACLKR
ncbi:zinc finger BED domain-containing protein RICESLEEPER 2-like protein [Tanacetum coccineum]